MAEGGMTVLDGTQLRVPDLSLPSPGGAVSGARILELAGSAAADPLLGLYLPESVKSAALVRMADDGAAGFLTTEFGEAEARDKLRQYLTALADQLRDDPLVVSVLDGSALHLFLDDEDDFAMLAEDLFTDLDTGDKGKLSKNEIRNALIHMGVEMGVPSFSDCNDLLTTILKKHEAEGEEELGQAQFAELLQHILQDLADALAKTHITVIQNIKVVNGSKLRKVLSDEKILSDAIESMYQNWVDYKTGEENRERLRGFLESKGLDLGLPPSESNEGLVLLYDQIFSSVDKEKFDREWEKDAFAEVLKDVLEKFSGKLEANPVFVDLES